jgi:hypothetical protein
MLCERCTGEHSTMSLKQPAMSTKPSAPLTDSSQFHWNLASLAQASSVNYSLPPGALPTITATRYIAIAFPHTLTLAAFGMLCENCLCSMDAARNVLSRWSRQLSRCFLTLGSTLWDAFLITEVLLGIIWGHFLVFGQRGWIFLRFYLNCVLIVFVFIFSSP